MLQGVSEKGRGKSRNQILFNPFTVAEPGKKVRVGH